MDITLDHLTKRYGPTAAVDDLSFTARAGRITGFLGPNGAGKTTTLRVLLGLARPAAGSALIGGRSIRDLDHPARSVGAVLEPAVGHPGRRVANQLAISAQLAETDPDIGAVLDEVGLTAAARRRIRALSLGMRQRLALGVALIADPSALVLDEPFNGLDPSGVRWLRDLLRQRAAQGAAVLLSSHLLAEITQVAHDVAIIDRGQLVAAGPIDDFGDLEETFLRVTGHRGGTCDD